MFLTGSFYSSFAAGIGKYHQQVFRIHHYKVCLFAFACIIVCSFLQQVPCSFANFLALTLRFLGFLLGEVSSVSCHILNLREYSLRRHLNHKQPQYNIEIHHYYEILLYYEIRLGMNSFNLGVI